MNTESHPVIQAQSVSRVFSRRRGIFSWQHTVGVAGVSLELGQGEIVGLVGESGSGKTTLSRMLMGLDKPTAGEILLLGRPLAQFSRLERARHIQMVYQDPYSSLNPARTVGTVLDHALVVHGISDAQDRRRRVAQALELVGLLPRHAANLPSQLSGGQRQRVVIARALILQPKVVICDEPTSALDVSIQAQILNLLLELRARLGLSYLFVSHNLAVVEHMATRVAVMYAGRVVEMNEAEELFRRPRHPYTRLLANSGGDSRREAQRPASASL
ncbi:MAG: ABC transporter ATP-binding protein [Betaproteobacteria bacterium]|nr:ABC transporter ATP-binding protein [Betaproteobacteria bacterium]